jgi:hypothetical protein
MCVSSHRAAFTISYQLWIAVFAHFLHALRGLAASIEVKIVPHANARMSLLLYRHGE